MGGLIRGNFDEVRSTFGLVAVSAFVVAMRTRVSGLMNMQICTVRLYFVPLAVTSRYNIPYVKKEPVDKNGPPMIKFTSPFSFCPNYIAKSVKHFSKNYGDSRDHRPRFAHHILKLHASCCTVLSGPAGRNQLLPMKFRGVLLSLSIGTPFKSFMHNSCT